MWSHSVAFNPQEERVDFTIIFRLHSFSPIAVCRFGTDFSDIIFGIWAGFATMSEPDIDGDIFAKTS